MKRTITEILDCVAFVAIVAGMFFACAYLAPDQRSAECEYQAEVSK